MINKVNNSNTESEFINLASVLSSISVVFLHANGCFWIFSSTEKYWKTANIIECIFYFAVPVFFMISGATLLDFYKRYGLREYFLKRIKKSFIPYFVWSIIGLIFQVFYLRNIDIGMLNANYIINGIVSGKLVGVYWFFIPLFCTYLSIPLFSAISEDRRKEVFTYLGLICFAANVLVPFIINTTGVNINYPISVNVGSGYLLFIILGYLLSNYSLELKLRYIIYILAAIGLMLHVWGTYYLSMGANKIVFTYKGYLNLPSVLYSIGIFLFFKLHGSNLMKNCFIRKTINFLKAYTFSIYLIHWYVLQLIIREFSINIKNIFFRLGSPFVIIAISIVFIQIVRKIPIIRNILP